MMTLTSLGTSLPVATRSRFMKFTSVVKTQERVLGSALQAAAWGMIRKPISPAFCPIGLATSKNQVLYPPLIPRTGRPKSAGWIFARFEIGESV